MRFVHIADMHFDVPFTTLAKNNFGETRRIEQRKILKEIIEYIQRNRIEYLFICGDLYEQEYVKKSTIEYINNQFSQIPETKIYIVPGNHDPYLKNSYYSQYNWNKNVYIFTNRLQKIDNGNIHIYGYGFNSFYMENSLIQQIEIKEKEEINILLTHGALESSKDKNYNQYNPMQKNEIKKLGFNYVALGHIHKPYYKEEINQNIIYPGATISLGFDELGKHGMIVGQIDENRKLEIQFVPLDKKEFVEVEINVSNIYQKEELIEAINETQLEENKFYKIILVGERNFEINTYELEKYTNEEIIKIKDETKIKQDLEEIAKQKSLKGIFVRNMLEKLYKIEQQIAKKTEDVEETSIFSELKNDETRREIFGELENGEIRGEIFIELENSEVRGKNSNELNELMKEANTIKKAIEIGIDAIDT